MKTFIKNLFKTENYSPSDIILIMYFACLASAIISLVVIARNKNKMYSNEEYERFKTGDTIYYKEYSLVQRGVVLRNDTKFDILEVKDLESKSHIVFIEYD